MGKRQPSFKGRTELPTNIPDKTGTSIRVVSGAHSLQFCPGHRFKGLNTKPLVLVFELGKFDFEVICDDVVVAIGHEENWHFLLLRFS